MTKVENHGKVTNQTVIHIDRLAGNIVAPNPAINIPSPVLAPFGGATGNIIQNDDALVLTLCGKTLTKLCDIINEIGWGYRSGAKLVDFFNDLGFSHDYPDAVGFWEHFPSRADYTKRMLEEINGTIRLKDCIKNAFAVGDFIERLAELDELISTFNLYLALDDWAIARDHARIVFVGSSKEAGIESGQAAIDINRNYYNLFVTTDDIKNGRTAIMKNRVLTGDIDIVKKLAGLSEESRKQLMTFPSLIMNENTEFGGITVPEQMAFFGFITDIKVQQIGNVRIKFHSVAEISQQAVNAISDALDIFGGSGVTELNHTHWTIKNVDLIEELTEAGLLMLTTAADIGA